MSRLLPYGVLNTCIHCIILYRIFKCWSKGWGGIKLSEFIETPERLVIEDDIKIQLTTQHQDYMAYHRKHIFRC